MAIVLFLFRMEYRSTFCRYAGTNQICRYLDSRISLGYMLPTAKTAKGEHGRLRPHPDPTKTECCPILVLDRVLPDTDGLWRLSSRYRSYIATQI
jgi:hypothetical protein